MWLLCHVGVDIMKQNGLQSKYRRKIKIKGLNIWTKAEKGQDKKRIMNDEF